MKKFKVCYLFKVLCHKCLHGIMLVIVVAQFLSKIHWPGICFSDTRAESANFIRFRIGPYMFDFSYCFLKRVLVKAKVTKPWFNICDGISISYYYSPFPRSVRSLKHMVCNLLILFPEWLYASQMSASHNLSHSDYDHNYRH